MSIFGGGGRLRIETDSETYNNLCSGTICKILSRGGKI
jgi:hypothetical protein